jgi:hypothetical protein
LVGEAVLSEKEHVSNILRDKREALGIMRDTVRDRLARDPENQGLIDELERLESEIRRLMGRHNESTKVLSAGQITSFRSVLDRVHSGTVGDLTNAALLELSSRLRQTLK